MTVVNGYRLVSNSEIQTYKKCRRRWYLSWYLGLAPRYRNVQGVRSTGTRLHVGLEARYQPGKPAPLSVVLAALRAAQAEDLASAQAQPFPDGDLLKKLSRDFELEQIMLTGYLEWLEEEGADANLEVISSEAYVEAEIPGVAGNTDVPPVKVIGKLDTRVMDVRTGRRAFIDHKSVSTFKVPMLGQNQQILHYELLEFLSLPDADSRCDAAYYNMLRRVRRSAKAIPPFYKRVEVRHNQHELRAYEQHLVGTVTDIQNTERALREDRKMLPLVAYPTPSRDCDWQCDFQQVCRMFDDGSRVQAALDERFEKVNPLDYYQGKEREEREE